MGHQLESTNSPAVNANPYIPPPGIYFRIYCPSTQRILCSRLKNEPTFMSWGPPDMDQPGPDSDQWFSLIRGNGDFIDRFLIKSRLTGKFMYSVPAALEERCVGHCDGAVWKTDHTHFKLISGEGQWNEHFRLVVDAFNEERAVCSGTLENRDKLSNYPAKAVFDNQYFCFLYEDLNFREIRFDLASGKILSESLQTLDTKKLVNKTSVVQDADVSLMGSYDHTSNFAYISGKSVTSGEKLTARTPFVNDDGSISIDTNEQRSCLWNTDESLPRSYDARLNVHAPSGKTIVASLMVTKGVLEVPFTAIFTSETGVKTESRGMWRGTLTWDCQCLLTEY